MGGGGRLPEAEPVDLDLSGTPIWVAAAPLEEDTAWVVTYNDGRVEAFRLDGGSGEVVPWLTAPHRRPAGAPRLFVARVGHLELVSLGGVPLTHTVPAVGGLLGVASDGRLVSDTEQAPPVSALPDACIVEGEDGSLAVLSDSNRRYVHGVLGDEFEAESIEVLEAGDVRE